jgi:hypothetical protein
LAAEVDTSDPEAPAISARRPHLARG